MAVNQGEHMNNFRWLAFAFLLSIVLAGVQSPVDSYEGPIGNKSQVRSVTLLQFLREMGNRYNQFFTLDEAAKPGKSDNWMEVYSIQRSRQKIGLTQELTRLQHLVPNFTYEIDSAKPQIIHIIDSRLTQQQGYGLEDLVKRINFTGIGFDLVNAIGEQGIPITARGAADASELLSMDFATKFHVEGDGLKVRDALSNFIPLHGRRPILWIARTRLGKGEKTYVQFYGRPPS
jgi:hypothetical protein